MYHMRVLRAVSFCDGATTDAAHLRAFRIHRTHKHTQAQTGSQAYRSMFPAVFHVREWAAVLQAYSTISKTTRVARKWYTSDHHINFEVYRLKGEATEGELPV